LLQALPQWGEFTAAYRFFGNSANACRSHVVDCSAGSVITSKGESSPGPYVPGRGFRRLPYTTAMFLVMRYSE